MQTNVHIWGGQSLNKKAFTLIELLAVIVILAIIALIATPIILNIINDSKKQSNERSAELYLKAAELAIARENLNGELNASSCDVITNETKSNFEGSEEGDLNCGGKLVKVEMDGEKPKSGKLTFTNGKITNLTSYKVGDTSYKLKNGSLVVDDGTEEEEAFTGTVYRNSTDTVTIGDSIIPQEKTVYCAIVQEDDVINSCDFRMYFNSKSECETFLSDGEMTGTCETSSSTIGLSSYETEETKSNITQNVYLKHEVENNIVTASYVCIRYGTNEEACIRGGDPSYYGSFDGMTSSSVNEVTNPTGNIAEIAKTRSYFSSNAGSCNFSDSNSNCNASSLRFSADAGGDVSAGDDSVECDVTDGSAYCQSES